MPKLKKGVVKNQRKQFYVCQIVLRVERGWRGMREILGAWQTEPPQRQPVPRAPEGWRGRARDHRARLAAPQGGPGRCQGRQSDTGAVGRALVDRKAGESAPTGLGWAPLGSAAVTWATGLFSYLLFYFWLSLLPDFHVVNNGIFFFPVDLALLHSKVVSKILSFWKP